jgi:hypothetical protein
MPTIAFVDGIAIILFWNDHDPPHFHVIGVEFSAKFTIADQELISCKGNRGKSVGIGAFFPCADSAPWILCVMCLRQRSFPR